MNIHADMHPRADTPITGNAFHDQMVGVYPAIKFGGSYPGLTVFPSTMATTLRIAEACLDAIVAMTAKGKTIDPETHEMLVRLAERASALSFDEDAETEAAEVVANA